MGFPSNWLYEQKETLLCHGILSFEPGLQLEKWKRWFWDVFPLRDCKWGLRVPWQCKQWVSRTYPGVLSDIFFILFQVSELKPCLVWMTKLCQTVELLEPTLYALLEKSHLSSWEVRTGAAAWCSEFEAWFCSLSSLNVCLMSEIILVLFQTILQSCLIWDTSKSYGQLHVALPVVSWHVVFQSSSLSQLGLN